MKKTCLLLILAALLSLSFTLPIQADEAPKYNFASAQGEKELKIPPGAEGNGYIYFYNIDGNRITHITLAVSQAPSGWDVSIEPPLGENQVLVSGMPVTVEENLYVEPGELLDEEPLTVPEGMVSIRVPGRGYALGKSARVTVSVPESATLGSTGEITIAAEAAWLGQSGSAAIKQARDFDFTVTVVSGQTEYTETIISPGEIAETTGENIQADADDETTGMLPPASAESSGFSLTGWPLAVIIGVIGIIVVIFIVMLVRRRG